MSTRLSIPHRLVSYEPVSAVGGSFEEWYQNEHPRLLATILLATGSVDVAEDAVDEAFTRALLRWERVSRMASPEAWTYRVALKVARRRWRREALERHLLRSTQRTTAMTGPA